MSSTDDLKYLPQWNARRVWTRGEVVVFEGLRYVCRVRTTSNASPKDAPSAWQYLPRRVT